MTFFSLPGVSVGIVNYSDLGLEPLILAFHILIRFDHSLFLNKKSIPMLCETLETLWHFILALYFIFSKFYRRHYELISKYNVGLKLLLSEGLSEPEFYGDLVYKFKKLIGSNDFSFQFRKIIIRYRHIGYNLNVMRQSACLVFNPIMVDNYASLIARRWVGRQTL